MQSVNDVRSGFLEFFKRNGHEVRPSSSLVPHNDPTLMFSNAGMNQFKDVFTGAEKLPYSRAATSQKCVRAGGKHNDLDNVGYTARHHTFFEMLGNFSFGDYFKETAIEHAWKLLTEDYKIDKNKLSFTVYHTDDEAFNLWKKITGCDESRILRIPTKDNFWSMGDTGPCGPCSEIFYDHGMGNGEWALNADGSDKFDARFVEIWNLVFMQYEQVDANTRIDLPKPSIDTGMGLERIAAVMQGVHDNYDIDLFRHVIAAIKDEAAALGAKPSADPAPYKVLADHLRSSCFLIADGVMPSNEGRGYVLRRIMRRGMRYAHQLGCKDPLMFKLVPSLVAEMGGQYPELKRAEAAITDNLKQEEERFKQTLERGLKLLDEAVDEIKVGGKVLPVNALVAAFDNSLPDADKNTIVSATATMKGSSSANFIGDAKKVLPGEIAFKLYDTYGFPLDLTQDILRQRGMEVDTDGFETSMEGQREMARAAWSGSGDKATGRIWFDLKETIGATPFLGYEKDEADAEVLSIVKDSAAVDSAGAGDEAFVVLSHTPFYGESGGQVGDIGQLSMGGKPVGMVLDTQKPIDGFHVHKVKFSAPVKKGDKVHGAIDLANRAKIRANHSATHLLHKALRDTLGDHVTQKGSQVAPDRLRFDFSHSKAVSKDEIAAIERKVNSVIWKKTPVDMKVMSPDEAIKAGAMALFGEKYGDEVRVLSMGDDEGKHYSVELCGGTHVHNTGDIALFKVTSEGSVASGIRRIEAVTGDAVRGFMAEEVAKLREQVEKLHGDQAQMVSQVKAAGGKASEVAPLPAFSAAELGTAPAAQLLDLFDAMMARQKDMAAALVEENKKLNKQLSEARKAQALGAGSEATVEKIGAVGFIGKAFDGLDPKELRGLAEGYLKQADVVAVGTVVEGKASVVVAVAKAHMEKISAVTLVQAAVSELGGKGGGGRPDMAQGGGPDADKLESALGKVKGLLVK